MKTKFDVIFFDLFFTLVLPKYNTGRNENDVLNMKKDDWEYIFEDSELYLRRATGKVKRPESIVNEVLLKAKIETTNNCKKEIQYLRENRFKNALCSIDPMILDVLENIRKQNIKLCIISNADIIDVMHWDDSPLASIFDDAIFSYEVGAVKPDSRVYKIAMDKMKTTPDKCLFIGDGGSCELSGAKQVGMTTVLTEYLLKRNNKQVLELKRHADYHVKIFSEIISLL